MIRPIVSVLSAVCTLGPVSRAEDPPTVTTQYFLGESKMLTPDGRVIRTTLSLVKRVLKPAENKVEEHVLSADEKTPAKAFVVVLDVAGNKFTLADQSKTYSGDGELKGEPWKWTAWKSTSKLAGGATVVSEDKLSDRGMTATKTYSAADGKPQYLFEEKLEHVSAKTYEILYAKLAPVAGK
jgi:hypothetical protein